MTWWELALHECGASFVGIPRRGEQRPQWQVKREITITARQVDGSKRLGQTINVRSYRGRDCALNQFVKYRAGAFAPVRRFASGFLFAHVLLPVLIGGVIYSLWRSKTLLVFAFYRWIGLDEPVQALRLQLASFKHLIPGPVLYSLPDGLWVYAFTSLMGFIWFRVPRSSAKLLWTLLPVSMAMGAEIGQGFRLVPGTFDWSDMLSYLIAWALATVSVQMFLGGKRLQFSARRLHV